MVASSQRRRALEHPTATALMHRRRERIPTEVLSNVCLWHHIRTHAPQQSEPYSIASSARPIKVAGTVRPSALAVLRLTSVSNLVGSRTGEFAGFVALRTRSM